jgi:hypothetical protein
MDKEGKSYVTLFGISLSEHGGAKRPIGQIHCEGADQRPGYQPEDEASASADHGFETALLNPADHPPSQAKNNRRTT